jgi:predicted small secreted protein
MGYWGLVGGRYLGFWLRTAKKERFMKVQRFVFVVLVAGSFWVTGCETISSKGDIAVRKDLHFLLNPAISWNEDQVGLTWELVALHWSAIPFTSAGIGFGLGYLNDGEDWWLGVTPYIGLVFPFSETVKLFTDGLAEIGFDSKGGISKPVPGLSINPGWDIGLRFNILDTGFGIEVKYRGVAHPDNRFVNSFGIAFIVNFWDGL